MTEQPIQNEGTIERGMASDLIIGFATTVGLVGGGAAHGADEAYVTDKLSSPPKEEPPKVSLPPGTPEESRRGAATRSAG